MVEAILFNVTADIIFKLGTSAFRELGSLWGINDELDKLNHSLSAIKAVLHDAEEQQLKNNQVEAWVSRLKDDVLYEIEDLMGELSYEALRRQIETRGRTKSKQVRIFFSKSNPIIFRHKIAQKIKEIRDSLKDIHDDKTQFGFSSQPLVIDTRGRYDDVLRGRREAGSYIGEEEVIGRNDDKETVIDRLLNNNTIEDNISVISIVGMGGLGKTALAQSIYNHNRTVKNQFSLKLWVCVSEEFDVKTIIRKIIESATGNVPHSSLQMDTLEKELKSQIDGNKYLLVMDDVWNETKGKWLDLKRLLMGGAKGSRILITTRSEQVAKTFDTTFLHSLQNLDASNSWLLFKKMTGLAGHSDNQEELDQKNSKLIQTGKEIVSRLKGVPLVIRTIGGLLKDNKSEKFWLSFKDKELNHVLEQEQDDLKEIRSILELSYKYLPSNLKQCFLYCALFPKDYEIQKDELILLWRAQGFIQPNGNNDDNLVEIGDGYFMELLSRSFFQEVTNNDLGDLKACKMHDLMHDLACWITNNECLHGQIGNYVINKRTHHLSWKGYCDEDTLLGPLSKSPHLRTFFLIGYADLKLDLENTFQYFLSLRTLHLNIPISNFFEFIGKLKHLRYLSIEVIDITYLPNSITKLYNLETFILKNSFNLENVSNDIKNLINLKHLDLSNSLELKSLPDSITELYKLETFILQGCQELRGLPKDIKSWINLRHLDLSHNNIIQFLPDSIVQLNRLEILILSRCVKLRELHKDMKKLINLKHLDLYGCRVLTHMPKGLGELTNLQTMNQFVLGKNKGGELNELDGLAMLRGTLIIEHLEFCTSIVDRQMKCKFLQLKSGLENLELNWRESYDETTIGDTDDVMYESVLDCLQPHSNLREISIYGYNGVKLCNWLSSNSLGCLVTIKLHNCQRLQHLLRLDQLPSLKYLHLEDLPNIEYIMIENDDSVSSSTFFPSLEKIFIADMPKLERWWKGSTTTSTNSPLTFPCVSQLHIQACPLHVLNFFHAPNLKSLGITNSEDEWDHNVVPWRNFENLTSLQLNHLAELEYFPDCWQHYMTRLQNLSLGDCENLKSLPEWIGNLTSLIGLEIWFSRKLALLPEEIRHISGLQWLRITGCPILKERCKKYTGEDWPKIAHIPKLEIS